MNGCIGDRLCHSCRMRSRPAAGRKFIWTIELDSILCRAYRNAHTAWNCRPISIISRKVQDSLETSSWIVLSSLGWRFHTSAWTAEEMQILEERAGQFTPKALAAKLNRTHASVKAKMKERGLSARVSEATRRRSAAVTWC